MNNPPLEYISKMEELKDVGTYVLVGSSHL